MISRELRLRTASALVLGLGVLILAWFGGFPYRLFCVLLGGLILHEWQAISHTAGASARLGRTAWGAFALAGLFMLFDQMAPASLVLVVGAAALIYRVRRQVTGAWIGAGLLYAGFSALFLILLRGRGGDGLWALTFVLAIVWASDIFAYFAGRALGGRKLAPSVSPGKTVSGAAFGTLAGIGAGVALALLAGGRGGLAVPLAAFFLSILSQMGDLAESWFKRKFGAKDSGRLIPGHGGVMDRVDGLVAAASGAALVSLLAGAPYDLPSLLQGNG